MKRMHALATLTTLALTAGAFAGPVTVDFSSTASLHGRGSFTGTAVYDNTTDTLTLDLTNSSAGALTAFAFETVSGDSAKFVRPTGSPFKDETNKKGIINARPYGKYEGGAGVGGKWSSTAANKGLAAGQSETFVFDITGADASTLTTASFFTDTKPQFVAHFAGFKGHKQDKASGFGHVVPDGTTTNNDSPILTVNPPVVISPPGNTIAPPGNGGTVAAVPLPPAAPAGIAMLLILAIGGGFKRLRAVFV